MSPAPSVCERTDIKARIQSGAVRGKSGPAAAEIRPATELIGAVWMGRYIDEILQPGEKVLYSTNAHWIFYLPAIACWIAALALFLLSRGVEARGVATMWLVL